MMLRYLTAGESHGKALTSIVEGMPANLPLEESYINFQLARRQRGYGRGGRMKIESDSVQILSGLRHGKLTGAPISFFIENKDWTNWEEIMSSSVVAGYETKVDKRSLPVTRPRPGHADLTGAIKYNQRDVRNILERSSARETAIRVASCSVARRFLEEFGIKVYSWVTEIGGVASENSAFNGSLYYQNRKNANWSLEDTFSKTEDSDVRCPDKELTDNIKKKIDDAKEQGDSLGGIFEVVVSGLPPGLGSHVQSDRKIDANLAGAIMSIQAIKGVEIGLGFEEGRMPGSQVHDEIFYKDSKFSRETNNSGGIEGGMTNGEDVVIRAVMKPIPTLYKPLRSVDIETKEAFEASIERSDVCAVPAAAVIAESVAAFEIARLFLQKFGGDSMEEIRRNYDAYVSYVAQF